MPEASLQVPFMVSGEVIAVADQVILSQLDANTHSVYWGVGVAVRGRHAHW